LNERRTTQVGNTTVTTTITHKSSKIWVQNYVNLQNGQMQYQPGSYVIPFQFALPANVPGSASFIPGDGHAYISYIFNVEGVVPGTFTSNLRHSMNILVVQIYNRPIDPVSVYEDAMVTTMCCVDVGSMRFRACMDKNAFRPGETAIVNLFIDNSTSEVGYRYVSVKLRQIYVAVAGPSNFTATASKTMAKNRTPKIPAGETVHATIPLVLPMDVLPSAGGCALTLCYGIQVVFSLRNSADITGLLPITMYVLRTVQDDGSVTMQPMFAPMAPPTPTPEQMVPPMKN
jgi:hypothetical protein